jgi:hypothetical protein
MDNLNGFLAQYSPEVQAIALKIRDLILEVLPGTIEQPDATSKIIAYGDDRTYKGLICAIAPQKTYVNLMFSRGTELPDRGALLEGTGKRARHIKIKTLAEADNPEIAKLLRAAGKLHTE